MKRSKIKPKPKKHPIPESVKQEVCERDGGTWEDGKCKHGKCKFIRNYSCSSESWFPDWCNLFNSFCKIQRQEIYYNGKWDFSHRSHRGMGGDPSKDTVDNIDFIPSCCHDLRDGRIKL